MHSRFSFALAGLVGLAAAGCAGTNVTPETFAANPASQAVAGGSGSLEAIGRDASALRIKHDKASYKKALYVADYNSNTITILTNNRYSKLGTITNGISDPVAESMDRQGNLYVANSSGNVTEYAPGATSPSFTYSAGMEFPFAVTVDRHGNVYEADYNGYVSEYNQGSNQATASCQSPNYPYSAANGVAVDPSGDVFVAESNDPGGIWEYPGGLAGCHATFLFYVYGDNINDLALDSNNNLLATTSSQNGVLVIAPPYSSVTRTIGAGYVSLVSLSLSKKNKLLFVAQGTGGVLIFKYGTGKLVKTLGSGYGITNASAVIDGPNAVY